MNKFRIVFSLLIVSILIGAWGSPDPFLEIQTKFENYNKKYIPVKINLVLNQPLYAAGDTAFFSAWYHNEEFVPIQGDHIITLELYTAEGHFTQRMRFKVRNGRGGNQFVFRENLLPGKYQLIAYTDWMKNAGTAWFYAKTITLVAEKQIERIPKADSPLAFYPEGGNLIKDIPTKIVVTGPPSTEITIRTAETEIVKFKTDSTGVGVFVIAPRLNQQYFAELQRAEKKWKLPEVSAEGLSIRLITEENDSFLKLAITANSNFAKEELYSVITSQGKIIMKQRVVLSEALDCTIQLPTITSGLALHQLFILNAKGKTLAQRVFLPGSQFQFKVAIDAPITSLQRERIPVKVSVMNSNGNSPASDVVISVIQDNLFKGFSLQDNFALSDLPEVSDRYKNSDDVIKTSMNDFLITQKWKRINWEIILGNELPKLSYPFKSTLTLKGNVFSKTTGKPAPDSTLVIGFLQNNVAGYESYTKNGYFEIPFDYDFFGEDQIFCTTQFKSRNMDSENSVAIVTDSTDILAPKLFTEKSVSSTYGKYVKNKKLISNSFAFFSRDQAKDLKRIQNSNAIWEEEFGGADYNVTLSDYVGFSTMKDVIHEIIPFVQYREKKDQESIRMMFKYNEKTKIYKDDPLYIIDGVMTRNTVFFLDIKPEDVISIKIMNNPNKLTQMGKIGENGVILVESKNATLANLLLQENHFQLVGLTLPIEFTSLVSLPARHPDLRSTLYWNSKLISTETERAESFFTTSDDIGLMRIFVQGLTSDHQYFSAEELIEVQYNPAKK